MKAAAVCDKAVAFQNAYESVHEIIRATEDEDYQAYLRTAATAVVTESVRAHSYYVVRIQISRYSLTLVAECW